MKRPTLRKFFDSINFKICGGAEYGWLCYGPYAYILDYNSKVSSASVIFDINNQTVYEISVCDYIKNKAFKWINPSYQEKHNKEMKNRKILEDEAWDGVKYEKIGVEKIFEIIKKITK